MSRPIEFTVGASPKTLRAATGPFVPFHGFKFFELFSSQQRRDLITFPFTKGLQHRSGFLTGPCSDFHLLPDTPQFIPPSQQNGFEGDFLMTVKLRKSADRRRLNGRPCCLRSSENRSNCSAVMTCSIWAFVSERMASILVFAASLVREPSRAASKIDFKRSRVEVTIDSIYAP